MKYKYPYEELTSIGDWIWISFSMLWSTKPLKILFEFGENQTDLHCWPYLTQ